MEILEAPSRFAEHLRARRQAERISMHRLADRSQTSVAMVCQIENGKSTPTLRTAERPSFEDTTLRVDPTSMVPADLLESRSHARAIKSDRARNRGGVRGNGRGSPPESLSVAAPQLVRPQTAVA
jgi:transcriptional regulator with XRE-family HTH domain